MSSLALLVVLLLVLVAALVLGALAYLAHRHPQTVAPLTLALCGAVRRCSRPSWCRSPSGDPGARRGRLAARHPGPPGARSATITWGGGTRRLG
ncbi:hypothetical protein [Streptomyces sp. NPDC091040]|uniref:hypothetical protein n=1 Tax=Streptomyces sp. NPDC091040 TaxID=3365972 RepID=UPI003820CF5D